MVNINFLIEWSVWAHLASQRNLELILLKGHLFLEIALDSILSKNNIKALENYSFHKKISSFENLKIKDKKKQDLIVSVLYTINKLRNKLAHEWKFDIQNGELESWSQIVLENFNGLKFSKYTYRTKIVHAFSILTNNILEMVDTKN